MGESKGNVKVDFVDKIMSTLERANIFVEVSRNRLRIADQLDDEASNDHRNDGHGHVDESNSVKTTTQDEDDNMDKLEEEGPKENFGINDHEEVTVRESEPVTKSAEFKGEEEIENDPDDVNDEVSSVEGNEPDNTDFVQEDKVKVGKLNDK